MDLGIKGSRSRVAENRSHNVRGSVIGPLCEGIRLPCREFLQLAERNGGSGVMGREEPGLAQARANVDAWTREIVSAGLEAIIVTASGCGATIKDYGHMLAGDAAYADKAAKVAALAKDASEYIASLNLDYPVPPKLRIAYHSACSLQHGQKITEAPKALLRQAGYDVRTPAESHLCCGSAGTYNILQPEIAGKLRDRKVGNIERLKPDVIAAGNIGCLTQIALGTDIPVVHMVELLDWAQGGPKPEAIA